MSNDGSGNPSAEDKAQYEAAKKELIQALNRKRQADKQLAQVELQIYNLEASYLTDTAAHSGGNIIIGYDNYLKNQGIGRRKYEVTDADRMFSSSSATYQKSLDLLGEGEESSATVDEFNKSGTVIVPPAGKPQESAAALAKKNRDREYQRAKRAARKRSGGTLSDDESVTSSGRRPMKRARITMEEE